jgi:hypothetical protein
VLVARHRGPLTADLHRYHGIRWTKIRESDWTVGEIADFAAALPHDSAVNRAIDPDWTLTRDTYLLREIEHNQRVQLWQHTKDGQQRHPQNYPAPLPITEAEAEAMRPEHEKFDVMTIDEADEFLGW